MTTLTITPRAAALSEIKRMAEYSLQYCSECKPDDLVGKNAFLQARIESILEYCDKQIIKVDVPQHVIDKRAAKELEAAKRRAERQGGVQ